ncbi:diacylglycerol kinase family protein [Phytomonospora sp. NPDC050363]|uniref:diacylglycerol/lipid kinase family protein n=1 Tax=Phytomonospora sp. NPDC050363 TaxID=3155642 RepID=UPI0033DAC603
MRAVLVVNPKATTTTDRGRDVLVRALRSEVDLVVEYTRRRGHAAEIATRAAGERVDVVVTLGGDGTVNEVVNGLLAGGRTADEAPALAVVPGGSTNVFARALGLPRDWAEGTGVILEALRDKRYRRIGLGTADGRFFTFCAGLGLDAAVIRRVERARVKGSTATPGLYLKSLFAQFLVGSDRSHPMVTLEREGESGKTNLAMAIVQNTAPWTYIGGRAVNPNPKASFDSGLDVMGLHALTTPATVRTAGQLLFGGDGPHGKQVVTLHDLGEFTLKSERPQPFQLDGDYVGERESVKFRSIPGALKVLT